MIRWPWLILAFIAGAGAAYWYVNSCWCRFLRFFAKERD